MKKIIVLSILSLLIIPLIIPQTVFASFSDVGANHHYRKSINWLQDQEVVAGYANNKFKPEENVNRAEFLKMLYETVGMEGVESTLPFSDVPDGEWYTKYVKEAYETGVIDGYPDNTFKPGNNINFAEAIKIIANGFFPVDSLYGTGESYASCMMDLSYMGEKDAWYWKYFSVADKLCVLPDYLNAEHSFDESGYVTRGDMAEMLYRAKAIKDHSYQKYDENKEPAKIKTTSSCRQVNYYTNKDYEFTFSCPTALHMLDIYGVVYISDNEVEYNEMMSGFFAPIMIGPTNETKNLNLLENMENVSEREVVSDNGTGTQYMGTTTGYLPYRTHDVTLTVFDDDNVTLVTYQNVLSEDDIDYNEIGDEIIETLYFY